MKSTRGSAAIIAIIFMMFLLIVGISFIPMINSELRHAKMDEDEQKAWYAAEAGKKYVEVFKNDKNKIVDASNEAMPVNRSNNTQRNHFQLRLDEDVPDNSKTKTNNGKKNAATLQPGTKYNVYSEGTFNGITKVIELEWTVPAK
ncbi:MAG TPA: pilus assembly PilX N-terminal domain-containing protein [Candidatus Avacidaminococcus intestinavium]|uniref:Pilus assembly PilX N-terminal domain-containing protein n=1 Tax=Candidatus Avacidaminococcus intestinavium TaxID=2840684 RepID=A0A9D1SLX2_9FIRM|nr:pilus assembly PilX N-terminal domain-containing protein [Candidatus Avacidaminococcus intestinavium]